MELQGKKVTHDFLSLYSSDSSFQLQDPRPPSQGFFLKTRDFLQPLERAEKCDVRRGEAAVADTAAAVPAERPAAEHVVPGGMGTYTIGHAADAGTRAGAVNPARSACGFPVGLETKPEPDYGCRSTTTSYGSYAGGASYTPWDDKDTASRGAGHWPSHFVAAGGSGNSGAISTPAAAAAATSGRHDSAPEKKRFMEADTSRSSRGYDGVDDEEEVFGKREGSSPRKDLTIKVDGKASCSDQRPNTPRSKHSATEQRRRSKINDRFQILRELIPHSDQKRDKASFLLEVIEYIRFLQEKVQKYESSYQGWNQDNAKLMPWNNSQAPANGLFVPPHVVKNDSAPPAHVFSKKFDEISIPVITPTPFSVHNPPATGVTAGISYKTMETTTGFASNPAAPHNLLQPRLFPVGRETSISQSQQSLSDADNMASQDRSPWLRSCSFADYAMNRKMLNEQEELTIDEGTISVSTAYSHGLLNTLTQALQNSGVDLSQANISVRINLGKRAITRSPTATATTSIVKDLEDPASFNQAIGHRRVGTSGEESSQASKRLKAHS